MSETLTRLVTLVAYGWAVICIWVSVDKRMV